MYLRTWKKSNKIYASVVKSIREGKKVRQITVVYIGEISENQIPYLKAAYSKVKPKLLYEDGTIYEG